MFESRTGACCVARDKNARSGRAGLARVSERQSLADAIAEIWRGGDWERMHHNCLSMRRALGMERWKSQVLAWLQS